MLRWREVEASWRQRSDAGDLGVDRQRCGKRGRFRFAVDQLLELLARLEVRHLLRRNVHLVAGLGIAPLPRFTPPEPETAEPPQLDLLAAMQRVDDALEDRVDDDLGV